MDELKTAKQVSQMPWPSPQDYNEAVQNPEQNFQDPELAQSAAECDTFGIPRPSTGMFASVYQMRSGRKSWALRCFLHFFPDQVERYAAIGAALKEHKFASTLNFELQEFGALLHGQWFPILKMEWCDGETLDHWLAGNLHNPAELEKFQKEFVEILSELKASGIAHGDLQHGNIMISHGKIRLVDYDGMYVPVLENKQSHELGHRDYQHPNRTHRDFGPNLDHFSAWLIYLTVEIIKRDPTLWNLLNGGEDCLIFRKKDLDKPRNSQAFYILENHDDAGIQLAARRLRYLLSLPIDSLPFISEELEPPAVLPALFVPAQWRNSGSQVIGSLSDPDPESDEEYTLRELDQGPAARQPKRTRSRSKGGSSSYTWRPERRQDTESESPPLILSPLAQLVRKVKTGEPARESYLTQLAEQTAITPSPQAQVPSSSFNPWKLLLKILTAILFSMKALGLVYIALIAVFLVIVLVGLILSFLGVIKISIP